MKEITYILVLLLMIVSCSQKPKSEAIVQKTSPIEQKTDTDTLQRFVEKLFCEIVPKHKANELNHTYLTHDFEKLVDEYYSDDMNNDIWTICSDRSKLKYEVGKVQRLSADSAFLDIVCHNEGNTAKIKAQLLMENGKWKIDNLNHRKEVIMTQKNLPIALTGKQKEFTVRYVKETFGPDEEEKDHIDICKNGRVVAKCKVPSGYAVNDYDVSVLVPTAKGFFISLMWSGINNIHDVQYSIEYRGSKFYLVYAEDGVCTPADEGEEDKVDIRKKSFTKPVPFAGMDLLDYLQF